MSVPAGPLPEREPSIGLEPMTPSLPWKDRADPSALTGPEPLCAAESGGRPEPAVPADRPLSVPSDSRPEPEAQREAARIVLAWGDPLPRARASEGFCWQGCRGTTQWGEACFAPVHRGEACRQHRPPAPLEWKPAEEPDRETVYFIAGADRIKIGRTTDVQKRLGALACISPVPLRVLRVVDGHDWLESELHRAFAADRTHGEWFRRTPRLLKLVTSASDERIRRFSSPYREYADHPEPVAFELVEYAQWLGRKGDVFPPSRPTIELGPPPSPGEVPARGGTA